MTKAINHLLMASISLVCFALPTHANSAEKLISQIDQIPDVSEMEEVKALLAEQISLEIKNLESLIDDGEVVAQAGNNRRRSRSTGRDTNLDRALRLAQTGQYQEASKLLFAMSRSPRYIQNSAQVRYILGLMLYEMKLNQSAAFVFYEVIRQESRKPNSKYLRLALSKLALAADTLNSDVLIRYAVRQVKESDFPDANRDMLYYRIGEVRMQEGKFQEAAEAFGKVRSNSIFFPRARYNMGLAFAEAGQLDRAKVAFETLAESNRATGVTNTIRVSSILGRARTLYQKKDFEGAIEAYREVPRDTEAWHDALFESSWAMLRDGRFRSALSNFHSLHSAYYEDVYQPESLFLRSIVYLYICRYDEVEKVIDLYERLYRPVQNNLRNLLNSISDPLSYYREIAKVQENFSTIKSSRNSRSGFQIPFIVARHVMKEGNVKRTMGYINALQQEERRINSMPDTWKRSAIGQYSKKIVEKRLKATQGLAGKQIRFHLAQLQAELKDLYEQMGFLRFEVLSSKKEVVRKEIAGKGLNLNTVDEQTERSYYIQNGFEYWPFKGEYWLDEIGNYHYVGVKACE